MAKGMFQVRINAQEGSDEEFLEWYETYFAPYVCALPGFLSARILRHRPPADNTNPGGENAYQYTAIYELEHDDLNEPLRRLYEVETATTNRIQVTDKIRLDPMTTEWLFEEVFFVPKQEPSIVETLHWDGTEMSTEVMDDATSKVLGWVGSSEK